MKLIYSENHLWYDEKELHSSYSHLFRDFNLLIQNNSIRIIFVCKYTTRYIKYGFLLKVTLYKLFFH